MAEKFIMREGTKRLLLTAISFFMLISASAYGTGSDKNDDVSIVLEGIEEKMKDITSVVANFIQTKKLSLFDNDLTLTGVMALEKPDSFAWHILSPLKYSMVIKNDRMLQWDEDTDKVRRISLSNSPLLEAISVKMRTWFYGGYSSMAEKYDITILQEDPLRLKFIPRDNTPEKDVINEVVLEFLRDGRYLKRISIIEKTGDTTVIDFTDIKLNSHIEKNIWKADHGKT